MSDPNELERDALRWVLEASRAGLLTWTPAAGTLHLDDALRRLLECSDEDASDARTFLTRVVHPSDRPVLRDLLSAEVRPRETVAFRVGDGDEARFFEAHARLDGERIVWLCRDVSDEARAKQALRESETQRREAEELALVGNWWWDVRSGEVKWSDQVFRIFHLDPETFVPQIDSILALSPWPEDHARDHELIERAIESRERGSYEQRFLRPDGSVGYYASTFQGLYDGDALVAMRGTVQDITERKLIELAHRRNEEDLRVTLESIGDAVIATDERGRVTRMNLVAEQLTGWTLAEARDRPLPEVFEIVNADTRAPVDNPVEQVLATDLVVGLANHTVLISRDGTEYQIADSGAPIRSGTGETIGVVLVFRDVTQAYALEERLRQSEKMEAVGRLAGGVAHDFNNLLTAIIGSSELLRAHLKDEPDAMEFHAAILHAAEQAASLTSKLLDFARQRPATKSSMDVHAAVEAALGILRYAATHKVKIETDLRASRSVIEGDPAQVQNAVLNLGINAAQAMPSGGTLSVTSRVVTLSEADCRHSTFELQPGPHIAVKVRDTGAGIAPELVGRIFEPFFTTKAPGEGTGLGMASVWATVQDCRGAIEVESQVGRGTDFTLLLPLTDRQLEVREEPTAVADGQGLVLVVDDEPLIRATAEASLRRLGYDVLLADGGRRAVALFEEHREVVDLVLLDMIMPDMDGRACFEAIRALDPGARVVLCSGFAHENDVSALREQGLLDVVRKPYRASTLGRVVHDAISRPKPST